MAFFRRGGVVFWGGGGLSGAVPLYFFLLSFCNVFLLFVTVIRFSGRAI